jgi:PD-(D/E)XK nuclease superfamily
MRPAIGKYDCTKFINLLIVAHSAERSQNNEFYQGDAHRTPFEQCYNAQAVVATESLLDRLDLSGDSRRARVIDYKTGRLNNDMAEVVVKGGSELQRCLYAFAVRTLLGPKIDVEASLLYPRAPEGEQALFPLDDVDAALELLAGAIAIARTNVENGLALPGTDAADGYNDFAFALPANAGYLPRKRPFAERHMGNATKIWEAV